jgi:multidrug efflux pump subunit AcrA (membrane-fusion protein)
LAKVVGDVEKGTSSPLAVESPKAGLLRNISAMPGQNVPSGAILFEVFNPAQVWVRVPVYVGDLNEVDPNGVAQVGGLAARPGTAGLPASPVTAPPTANPLTGTADFYFALDNQKAGLRPGERVGVTIPLRDKEESLTVPWSAVVHDINGGAWVYERTGDRTYVRRRVIVRYVHGDTAVLANGPTPGTKVVTAGAAELFGMEMGFSK